MSCRYRAEQIIIDGVPIIELEDRDRDIKASIVPSHGNIAFSLIHCKKNWLFSPYRSPAEMAGKNDLFGVPLLAPWANRLSSDRYAVNGARYQLNRSLGNLRLDKQGQAIHGLVLFANWTPVSIASTEFGAVVSSRLRFTDNPRWLAHFPFPHSLEMTHRVSNGRLTVRLSIISECSEPFPVSIGFHPYLNLPSADRRNWSITIPAASHLLLTGLHIPVGTKEAVQPNLPIPLATADLDDVFGDLERDDLGYAIFEAKDHGASLRVGYGPNYRIGVVYAPPDHNYFCFEPLAAPTDAIHLAVEGKYDALQYVPVGGVWTEEFWLEPCVNGAP